MRELAAHPAAKWISNQLLGDARSLLQRCMRCGAEETTALDVGDSVLLGWKRAFQMRHAPCGALKRSS